MNDPTAPEREESPSASPAVPSGDKLTFRWLYAHMPLSWWAWITGALITAVCFGIWIATTFLCRHGETEKKTTSTITDPSGRVFDNNADLRFLAPEENELPLYKLPPNVMGYMSVYEIMNGRTEMSMHSEMAHFLFRATTTDSEDFMIQVFVSQEDAEALDGQKNANLNHGLHSFVGSSVRSQKYAEGIVLWRSQLAVGTGDDCRIVTVNDERMCLWDIVASPRLDRVFRATLHDIRGIEVPKSPIGIMVAWETDDGAVMVSAPTWHDVASSTDNTVHFVPPLTLMAKPANWMRGDIFRPDTHTMHMWVFAGEPFVKLPDTVWANLGQAPLGSVEILGRSWLKLSGTDLIEKLNATLYAEPTLQILFHCYSFIDYNGKDLLMKLSYKHDDPRSYPNSALISKIYE